MSDKTETYQERMRRKLTVALSPVHLEIHDDSARHAGHLGHNPKGETHFIVMAVSAAFDNMSLVARHRMIYAAIADEMKERVHALTIKSYTPDEYNHR